MEFKEVVCKAEKFDGLHCILMIGVFKCNAVHFNEVYYSAGQLMGLK